MLLTQSTTPIIGWIATLLGYVMEFIFYCLNFIGIQNIGLCIIIFTIIVRLLMLPLTIKQQKFAKISQVMQPEINKIQRKYRNKTDQASMMKQNEEIQKVYEKYGTNPTGGCLQLVIQMPIFLALYQVIRKIPAYIPQVKAVYMQVVTAIAGQAGAIDTINKIGKGLKSSYVTTLASDATKNQIIDTLNYFNADAWHQLAKAIPSASDVINSSSTHIIGMNDFFAGINVSQVPGFHPSIYWLIPILAALFQYLSAKTMKQPELDGNNPAAGMTKSMTVMMPLMSLYFCLVTPAGLGLYWVTSALFQCLQQVIINKYMDSVDINILVAKNKEKAAKKKAKEQKTFLEKLMDTSAKADSGKEGVENSYERKTIKQIASINTKKIAGPEGTGKEDFDSLSSVDISKLGDIGKKAYMVSQYEKEHGNTRGGKK